MPKHPPYTNLDYSQVIKQVFDEDKDSLRVDGSLTLDGGTADLVISQEDDSIRIGDGTNLVTATIVDSKIGIDANIIGGIISSSGLSQGLKTTVLVVTDVPVKVPAIPLANRNGMSVRIWGSANVYLGDVNVNVIDGYPKRQYEEIILDVKDNAAVELYAVCDIGMTCELRIIELA